MSDIFATESKFIQLSGVFLSAFISVVEAFINKVKHTVKNYLNTFLIILIISFLSFLRYLSLVRNNFFKCKLQLQTKYN